MQDFVPTLIRMPRPVLKECFAGTQFTCITSTEVLGLLYFVSTLTSHAAARAHEVFCKCFSLLALLVQKYWLY